MYSDTYYMGRDSALSRNIFVQQFHVWDYPSQATTFQNRYQKKFVKSLLLEYLKCHFSFEAVPT